ncbi:MAG: 6-phosphofructokinase [Flavobacteriales bacterium]|jgi:6-phosphofructokinase 1|nr:6-phosphofructokinase [Flavobacteriales bacterium]
MEKSTLSENKIKTIGIFTSGGDAPGMNAAVRALVRIASYYQIRVLGFYDGYEGIIDNQFSELTNRDVGNILHRGGTILRSSRSTRFRTQEGREKAYKNCQENKIDALVAIGGDGTFKGLSVFYKEFGIPSMGIPGTIDNDLAGTDFTLGFDTARNTVVEAIDKIRDTGNSHKRLFFVEVMGRDSGFIALDSAIASGASAVMIPETQVSIEQLIEKIEKRQKGGKASNLIIVAEGNENGNAHELAEKMRQIRPEMKSRVTVLGHLQRGGAPSCLDRILAAKYAQKAIESLIKQKAPSMTAIQNNQIVLIPLENSIKKHPKPSNEVIKLSDILTY